MEMLAEPTVSFAVEKVGNLLIEEGSLLIGVRGHVEQIQDELRQMQCFLKDADARHVEGEMVRNWVLEIKEIVYETEDVIEIYVVKVASKGRGIRNILKRYACILNECIARHKVGLRIKVIETKISKLNGSLQTYGLRAMSTEGEGSSSLGRLLQLRRTYSHVVDQDHFVGLEKDVEKLVALLVNERGKDHKTGYQVVSICGMGGLGKTTLARKIYNHHNVKRHFDDSAWVSISQQWQKEDVMRAILIKLVPEEKKKKEILKMRDDRELVRLLVQVQQNKKCFIVLDDIWSTDAWDCLKHAIPIGKLGTKLVLTTRNKEVASHVDPKGFLHQQRFLNQDESWELFQKKAFTITDCADTKDDKIMELGRKMVGHCKGLPLAVVVLGGLLVTKHSLREWEMVHQNIDSYLRKGKGIGQEHGGVSEVLALSYNELPYQLKPCFLYLGSFMEDSEIQVEKLYQMWIAEGLVWSQDRGEEETMMDVAERYLGELAGRCMVQLQVHQGMFTSCRLHDMMRDLSLSKGKEENFLEVLDSRLISHGGGGGIQLVDHPSSSSISSKTWRVAIYLDKEVDVDEDGYHVLLKQENISPHLRSLLFFTPGEMGVDVPQMMKSYFKDFKLLRVLNLEGFNFLSVPDDLGFDISIGANINILLGRYKLPKAIGNLVHLRYLSIKHSKFTGLPSSMENLEYLQTLDLRVRSDFFMMPNVLQKMGRLRHLYLPVYTEIRNIWNRMKKLRLNLSSNQLETLENFDSKYFDVTTDLSMKLTNLRKLTGWISSGKLEDLEAIIHCLSMNHHLRHSSIDVWNYKFCSNEELTLLKQLLACPRLNGLLIHGVTRRPSFLWKPH
uniref:Disease resistance protein n=1 Tax=Davidia involucrata TaxID=16924 RepID=A0A5B7BM49_DAVIN